MPSHKLFGSQLFSSCLMVSSLPIDCRNAPSGIHWHLAAVLINWSFNQKNKPRPFYLQFKEEILKKNFALSLAGDREKAIVKWKLSILTRHTLSPISSTYLLAAYNSSSRNGCFERTRIKIELWNSTCNYRSWTLAQSDSQSWHSTCFRISQKWRSLNKIAWHTRKAAV